MNVRFTLEALMHIEAINLYLESKNPVAAKRIVSRIFNEAERLASFPHIGKPGTVPGTLEWKVGGLPYIIVHQMSDADIIVLGVFHGARNR